MTLVLKRKSVLLLILLVTIIVLLSFRTFAAYFTMWLNSDQAIQILMSHDLKLPEDLYFWGQNRLGSLIPILTHGLLQIIPLHPALAVGLVDYCFLIAGYLAFTSLLQNLLLKLVFALVWFLPLAPFNELVVISQPYGPQLALIGIAIALTQWLTNSKNSIGVIKRRFILVGITLCFILSTWISDFSVVTIFIFLCVVAFPRYKQILARSPQSLTQRLGLSLPEIGAILGTSIAGIAFILFAKLSATRRASDYGTFSTPDQIQFVISKLFNSFAETIQFKNGWFLGIHACIAIGLVLLIAYLFLSKKDGVRDSISRWTYLFIINAGLGLVLLILLQWVYKNGVNLRYFTVVYVSCWLAALLFADRLTGKSAKQITAVLVVLAIASTLSITPSPFLLQRPPSKLEKLAPLEKLGAVGFIGDYWASYVICTVNPALLNCTPYDKRGKIPCQQNPQLQDSVGRVRCRRCIPKVLAAETIYLVKNKWLEEFPQEIQQFKTCLVKVGEPQKVGEYRIAPYKKRPEPTS